MKKYITPVALFCAATTFVNATDVPTAIEWTDLTTTLSYNNTSDSGNTNHGIDAGRAGFETITNGSTSYTTIDSSKFDWQVSFQVDTISNTGADLMVFSTAGTIHGSGYEIIVKGDGTSYTAALFYTESGNQTRNDYLAGVDCGTDSDCDTTNKKTLSNCELSSDGGPATIALTWIATEKKLYLSVETGNTAGTTSSTKWIAYDEVDNSDSKLSLTTCSNIGDKTNPTGTIFWSNGGSASAGNTLQNISLRVHAIPEPSAFGLLAGLGAIALAVSRRKCCSR